MPSNTNPVPAPASGSRRHWARALCLLLAISACACKSQSGRQIQGEVRAACAMCIFEMKGIRGCIWAVEIDEQFYLAEGALPKHHEPHGPDGMCNVERRAIVDGEVIHGKFKARRFDLMPPAHIPDKPRFTPAHQH